MIKIRIKNADHEIDIRFPIRESELFAKLGEIHAVEGRDAAQSALVTEVYWPEEFSMLKDRFANLDELNYLGKRMESFDTLEYDQFLIGISKLDSKDVKDLINLTFNLNHFTLCQDVSNYGKIGREYVLNTEGAVPAHDEDDPKYATIGKDLIDRGLAQITERGLLIYNPFDELEEVYDGHTFPEYYYNNSLLSLNAEYGGRTELLQLPDEALAIKKAIDRLGAPSAEDCSYTVTFHNFKGDDWLARVQEIIANIEIKIRHLMMVLSSIPDIEITCTDSSECFDDNKAYLHERLEYEQNPKVRKLIKKDIEFLDNVQVEMATARQFLFTARIKASKDKQVFDTANRVEKIISEQGFEVRRMRKADIKRFLALYFEASMNGEQMPDIDGEQFYEVDEDEEDEA